MSTIRKSRAQYSVKFKLQVVREYNAMKMAPGAQTTFGGETAKMLAQKYGISAASIYAWAAAESKGLLSLDNAVAVSRRPEAVVTGDVYHLAGKNFKSKEEAIRYAVELAGGLTVSKMTTVAVEV